MCSCQDSKQNLSEFPELEAILPTDYLYTVCESSEIGENHYDSTFRVNVSTKDAALAWIEKFQSTSDAIFNKDRTFPGNSQRSVYKVYLKCIHNTRPRSNVKQPHEKHTKCLAKLIVTVKRTQNFSKKHYVSRSTDVHLPQYPMIVTYRNKHNHDLQSIDVIKHHPVNPDIKKLFLSYFEKGLTPRKALDEHKIYLKEMYGENYYDTLADGSIYPDKQKVYRWYVNAFKDKYVECSGEQMLQALELYIKKYNDDMKGRFCEMKKFDDGNFIIVIVTPLMRRILDYLPETEEILFLDSVDNIDTNGCKLYVFLTNSCCGGLPVGCLITASECEEVLNSGLELYKTFLNIDSFGGRGLAGPKIIMTDDSVSEIKSFQKAFPDANMLLCIFHALRASWLFIMNAKNDITVEDKKELFSHIKAMVCCNSKEEFNLLYHDLYDNEIDKIYPHFVTYVEKMYQKRHEWAKCFRQGLITKEQDTNDIFEAAMRIMKDTILNRTKAFSTTQLLSYIIKNIESFYEDKLISAANGHPPSYLKYFLKLNEQKIDNFRTMKLDEDYFQVKNHRNYENYVNTNIGLCTCSLGKNGAICKHQICISKEFEKGLKFTMLSSGVTQKSLLLFIATGEKDVPCKRFSPLIISVKSLSTENKESVETMDCNEDMEFLSEISEDMESLSEISEDTESLSEISEDIEFLSHDSDDMELISHNRKDMELISHNRKDMELISHNRKDMEFASSKSQNNKEGLEDHKENKTKIIEDFLNFSQMIAEKGKNNDETLHAIKKLLENAKKLKTDSSLNSALHCFGKFNGSFDVKKRKRS